MEGECKLDIPPYEDGNWCAWKEEPCRSNCLEKSRGVIVKRRFCRDKNRSSNKWAACARSPYDVILCDSSTLCNWRLRITIQEYINQNCEIFASFVTNIQTYGKQMVYNSDKPWEACTIFCRTKPDEDNVTIYYAPFLELTYINKRYSPYLPDGTWCHTENGQNYYCRNHLCLPESI